MRGRLPQIHIQSKIFITTTIKQMIISLFPLSFLLQCYALSEFSFRNHRPYIRCARNSVCDIVNWRCTCSFRLLLRNFIHLLKSDRFMALAFVSYYFAYYDKNCSKIWYHCDLHRNSRIIILELR